MYFCNQLYYYISVSNCHIPLSKAATGDESEINTAIN